MVGIASPSRWSPMQRWNRLNATTTRIGEASTKLFGIALLGILAAQTAPPVERWVDLGRAEMDGHALTFSSDETWLGPKLIIRTSHWKLVFDEPTSDGTKEIRFTDQVDCDRELRAMLSFKKYDNVGRFLSGREVLPAALKWHAMDDGFPSFADGYACIDGPGVKHGRPADDRK